jgi:hypothetical protein
VEQGDTPLVGEFDADAGQIGYDHVGVCQLRCLVRGREAQYLRPCGTAGTDARRYILDY